MTINLYNESTLTLYFEGLEALEEKLDLILSKVNILLQKENQTMASLDTLKAQVEKNTNLENSAISLIQGIAQQLREASGDPGKIQELTTQLSVSADALAAAITANTTT